jgi:hypothetical protein
VKTLLDRKKIFFFFLRFAIHFIAVHPEVKSSKKFENYSKNFSKMHKNCRSSRKEFEFQKNEFHKQTKKNPQCSK